MSVISAIIYGLIQGLTEFLPVSSSAHLALYARLANLPKENPLLLPVLMHVASILALIVVYRRDLVRLFGPDRRLGIYICIATVPALIAGAAFYQFRERATNDVHFVCGFLIVTGLILIAGDWIARRRKQLIGEHEMSWRAALAVGLGQAVSAALPGISRSGSTISTARAVGLTREASVRFSFLLSVPTMAAAAAYQGLKTVENARHGAALADLVPTLIAFVVALVSSYVAILVLIRIVRRVGLWVFAPYCFAVGVAGFIYIQFFGR